jgi:hypothetical protein
VYTHAGNNWQKSDVPQKRKKWDQTDHIYASAKPNGQFLVLGGESIYEGFGAAAHAHGLYEPNAQT